MSRRSASERVGFSSCCAAHASTVAIVSTGRRKDTCGSWPIAGRPRPLFFVSRFFSTRAYFPCHVNSRRLASGGNYVARRPCEKTKPKDPVWEIVKAMPLPKIELRSILNALFFMGYGLCEHGHDEGETIYTLAKRAQEQFAFIEEQVTDLAQAARD
jgi:hypothetical protein